MDAPIALVTGASKGIGKSIAIRLAQDGFSIWLNYRSDHQSAYEVQQEIEAAGASCKLLPFDVATQEDCADALAPLLEHSTPHILINNAGFARDGILAMMSNKDWNDVINVHLHGFFQVTRCVLPHMIRRHSGRIINIVSASGQFGVGGQVNYSAAKAGLIGATRSLAVEVAKRNILINAVAPGFIETSMTKDIPKDKVLSSIPMHRFGTPKEVAGVVSFLCSQDASYITGQVIGVNGGIFTG